MTTGGAKFGIIVASLLLASVTVEQSFSQTAEPVGLPRGSSQFGLLRQADGNNSVNGVTFPLPSGSIYQSIGKLYVETLDGSTHYCSAALVSDNVLLTAAHCLAPLGNKPEDKQRFSPIKFVLGEAPTGEGLSVITKFVCATHVNAWLSASDPFIRARYDYAFVRFNSSTHFNFLHVKTRAASTKKETDIPVQLVGYPAAMGKTMKFLPGTTDLDTLHPKLHALVSTSIYFTNGISGGPWVDTTGRIPQIVSLSSSFSDELYGENKYIVIYGPIFEPSSAQDLQDAVSGTDGAIGGAAPCEDF